MRRRGAHGRLTSAGRLELRLRVAAGERYEAAAAAVGCSTRSVQRVLAASGGVPPRTKPRSRLRLSLAEREEISRGSLEGASCRAIAARLGRAPSTVTRAVSSNGGRTKYRAWRAEDRTVEQACRPKVPKLVRSARLRRIVERRLAERWSPQQIAHRLVADHPDDPELRVSHETDLPVAVRAGAGRAAQEAHALPAHGAPSAVRAAGPRAAANWWGGGCCSASVPPRLRTERCPATGRATSSSAREGCPRCHVRGTPDALRDAARAARRSHR